MIPILTIELCLIDRPYTAPQQTALAVRKNASKTGRVKPKRIDVHRVQPTNLRTMKR